MTSHLQTTEPLQEINPARDLIWHSLWLGLLSLTALSHREKEFRPEFMFFVPSRDLMSDLGSKCHLALVLQSVFISVQIVSSCVTISWCYSDDQQGASRELARCLPQLFLVSCYCVRWRVYCNDTAKPLYKHKTSSQHLLLVSYSHITPWHTSSTQWMEDLFSFLLTLQPRVKWWETRDVVRETCVNV